ncbi:MAG: tRNA (adenosine(37)-N6)-threonylcarbamoyltransferase complex ATPase subunit type 1 TsaE [Weeping tea tree witches'-broom phytoplasma]|uniref:tRNA (adenosine(37)-N6)-threonylcarbamoyltransferase complex ATPase subunit type 1 TsaE n=1 Tax=Candidatus Phytoplasma melaleucae TaxID=2982630 RepID=UPI00293A04DF|nr:tRNA (adenosine(37)-N6)-threonylcarbamoyltransferase complex ATPase subunit type 1 TsaE [Weeping tea tree witches'-broom phytoplasma]
MQTQKRIIYYKKSSSTLKTKWAGAIFGNIILTYKHITQNKNIILIEGEMGSGKTVFIKGIAKQLGVNSNINSPTFTLWKTYLFQKRRIYHLDMYRVLNFPIKQLFIEELLEYLDLGDILLIETLPGINIDIIPFWNFRVYIDILKPKMRNICIEKSFFC